MTEQDRKRIEEAFQRYGAPSREWELRTYSHFLHPDELDKPERVIFYDKNAERAIKELESTIETLKSYRQALSERYNYLVTASTVPVVRLKRRRDYSSNKVFYDLILSIRFVDCGKDGKEVEQERTTYPGTARSQAIKDYNAYVKSHPGILAYLEIEKSQWER